MNIQQYIANVSAIFNKGNATEHSYRGDLQQLLQSMLPDVDITNEPKRIECGAPDYILSRRQIPVGYIEAKDIGVELGHKAHKEQFDRYKAALDNLIITDYLQFHFYKQGELKASCAIGEVSNGKIFANPDQFDSFANLIQNFALTVTQSIKSPVKLAQMMAAKAKLMADVIHKALDEDDANNTQSELKNQFNAFKTVLMHDINNAQFADIYAQTIAYGMFAARYHDPTLQNFSREEAARLIPQSNPFLRQLFRTVAGYNLDDTDGKRLLWIVEELVQIFLAADVASIMSDFGKKTRQQDPVVHFYETFLAAYDPKLRKARGVWYTPEPVVNFIVRAVDDILKTKFNLPQGLGDTSKTKIKVKTDKPDKRTNVGYVEIEKEIHKVQILDPATGTGTFLAQVVRHIYANQFASMQGMWPQYVKEHLIPRLNGFELLMTSYAMAHLKIDMLLTETGYVNNSAADRLRIYLTNSLENDDAPDLPLFNYLSAEANEANRIKRDAPVMVVMGNPPYSVSSSNKSKWIQDLLVDYKKDLNERKINLDDDYIKFIRFGQHFIDKNGEGVLAYISNNSFIDGITHRQMRKSLLESFDEIYILDLHGNAKKKETAPDGSKDENVFDITQGVSISLLIKNGHKLTNNLAEVFHADLYGKRDYKYTKLNEASISNLSWVKLSPVSPEFYLVPKDFVLENDYKKYFSISDLFSISSSGIESQKDQVAIKFTSNEIDSIKADFIANEPYLIHTKYTIYDTRDWKVSLATKDLLSKESKITNILYRPFDIRKTFYSGKSKGFIAYPRNEVMKHLLNHENIALLSCRQQTSFDFQHVFISKNITERCTVSLQTGEVGYVFPLYTYPDSTDLLAETTRTPNLNMQIVGEIAQGLGLTFTAERTTSVIPAQAGIHVDLKQNQKMDSRLRGNDEVVESEQTEFVPIDLLDYIYAVLHSPRYRETYKEFLKIDFPRVPYPKDAATFWQLVALGSELRQTHLLEACPATRMDAASQGSAINYPIGGNNVVDKISFEAGRANINATQYFENVPEVAWNFYIGGYQPAQKWLKDRKGRALNHEDIAHYQKIIGALTKTQALMQEIDKINID
jgi:predicted helicase